jgi:hypothetical protein
MNHWYPNDEAWKGTYDDWKTTDPRDLEPEEPPVEEDPDDARDRMIEDKYLREQFGEPDDDIEF